MCRHSIGNWTDGVGSWSADGKSIYFLSSRSGAAAVDFGGRYDIPVGKGRPWMNAMPKAAEMSLGGWNFTSAE